MSWFRRKQPLPPEPEVPEEEPMPEEEPEPEPEEVFSPVPGTDVPLNQDLLRGWLPVPNFETMSIEELIAYKQDIKVLMQTLRGKRLLAQEVYARKVLEWHGQEALKRIGLTGAVIIPDTLQLKTGAGAEDD